MPESVWRKPPVWWNPPRSERTRIYSTPAFLFDERGGDGDQYLFIEDAETNQIHVFYRRNF